MHIPLISLHPGSLKFFPNTLIYSPTLHHHRLENTGLCNNITQESGHMYVYIYVFLPHSSQFFQSRSRSRFMHGRLWRYRKNMCNNIHGARKYAIIRFYIASPRVWAHTNIVYVIYYIRLFYSGRSYGEAALFTWMFSLPK